jgi:hypothetical protein
VAHTVVDVIVFKLETLAGVPIALPCLQRLLVLFNSGTSLVKFWHEPCSEP